MSNGKTMIAKDLLSQLLEPLKTSDTGNYALSVMSDIYVKHLPIVNNKQLLGLISEEDVMDHNSTEAVGSYNLSLARPYVRDTDHLFTVMSMMSEYNLTIVPVVDEDKKYLGVITLEDLLHYYAKSFSFSEPGSIIVLEMRKRDYSLAQIAQIVESEQAAILSTFVSAGMQSENALVTIKINKKDIMNILSAFERYEYKVIGQFSEFEYIDTLKERYDHLMSYLNV